MRGARIGAETNAWAVRQQVSDQAAAEHVHWVRQERQRNYREVLDAYGEVSSEAYDFRMKLREGSSATEEEFRDLSRTFNRVHVTCSHLVLLGPDSVHNSGRYLRTCVGRMYETLKFWSDELTETPSPTEEEMHEYDEEAKERGAAMKYAYQDFMRESRDALLEIEGTRR